MIAIPLTVTPSQQVVVTLGGQNCVINVYQKEGIMYVDLTNGGVVAITGVIACDRNFIVRYPYLGFSGDLAFVDTQGTTDPVYTGFGPASANPRYVLLYLSPAEVTASTQ